ncbi:unnamed protein product [Anisakis simplex]|uniref:Peptidase A1 domain-containing protein n=1 Tax=Anisakis simplex TaxID=6269 RepID=A0A0M3KBC9_ANISI|nr:unnamed protein product [Anisakis simplex]
MKPPINTAGMYDMYVAPEDATAAARHANTNGSLRYDVDDTNIASYPCNKMNIYTYEEESIVIYLKNSNERVGFSMGGGADESLDSFINSVTPASLFNAECDPKLVASKRVIANFHLNFFFVLQNRQRFGLAK